jgi:mono/diheme cytochrome c family protein
MRKWNVVVVLASLLLAVACARLTKGVQTDPSVKAQQGRSSFGDESADNAKRMYDEGKKIFRDDTFGSEAFWGDKLQLHRAILGEKQGGVGPGLSPKEALKLGLKVDQGAMPEAAIQMIRRASLDLDKPETTIPLLKANAIVGVTGFFKDGKLTSVGIQCALCHSTVDDSLSPGIGRRLDGWPNRDLNIGAIVALAPNLKAYADLLGLPDAKLKEILLSWGPGKYDAEVNHDGKAFRPDGKSGAVLMPAAFGLAGVNLHTYTGSWGNVTYWNAYVANTQMRGQGIFFDPRLKNPKQYPLAVKLGDDNIRNQNDLITGKLAALQFYQLALPAPRPPANSYDANAAKHGADVFTKARCSTCHVPPLYTEPGYNLHDAEEIGIDAFQASRAPDVKYRTTPLRGLFTRMKGGFYHDGRFADLAAVVDHYDQHFRLNLSADDKRDLIEFLKSL